MDDHPPVMIGSSPRYLDLLRRLEQARSAGVVLGLERVRAVLDRLGNPERAGLAVHIAGTNGKGSTAAMTDAILRAGGLRTGLYTSPHLSRFTERIRVDGIEADGDRLAVLERRVAATGIPLTYFEIATVLAFLFFAEQNIEVAVFETGLGGRLDATSACLPVATAITSIAMDHAELLGDSLAKIAVEKAGIAKAGVPLFLGAVDPEADAAIATVASAVRAPLLRLGIDFTLPAGLPVALWGVHQQRNAALAVELAQVAAAAAGRPIAPHHIAAGLGNVAWPGRLEWLRGSASSGGPEEVLLDCAHNSEGSAALAAALDAMPSRRPRALVFSVVAGKPASEMLRLLAPRFDIIVLTQSSNPRTLTGDELRAALPAHMQAQAQVVPDPLQALTAARELLRGTSGFAPSRPVVVAAGSTFLVGDLRAALLGEKRDPLPTSDPIFPSSS